MLTLHWVQDAEEVEARNRQVAKREKDQAPGEAEQSGDTQQGTDLSLGSVKVTRPTLSVNKRSENTS